ncbi:hypothetical protein GCM10011492_34360 [Flexivirga endophytica]|uniref:Uncharacterized protein n=1 Tax=Flexivirga endophytica TaxID=1849103 RepID=A0A916TE86_9MICO|nr:hypothetical protein GCM10011492_34360 [Flexivirga endophytica]
MFVEAVMVPSAAMKYFVVTVAVPDRALGRFPVAVIEMVKELSPTETIDGALRLVLTVALVSRSAAYAVEADAMARVAAAPVTRRVFGAAKRSINGCMRKV